MLAKFNSYYQSHGLFNKTDKILLTISGGKDSIAMFHLFRESELSFGVAHSNFQLRGDAADLDEKFVRELAQKHDIIFYTKTFNTEQYANKNGISIQMAARDLRYDWFESIRLENEYNYIATAHHKNDVAETMLINLVKGTGLSGLHGISNQKGSIIRPLLCFSRKEIDNYISKNKIDFREDLSNADTKYIRNSIRHNIIPELEKINPSFVETLNTESMYFLGDEKIIADKINLDKKRLFTEKGTGFKIAIEVLKQLNPLNSYLYYFLRDYGFNSSSVSDIIDGLDGHSGQVYYSTTHQLVRDREFLLLNKIQVEKEEITKINSIEQFPFKSQLIDDFIDFEMEASSKHAYIDADKIEYPMVIRPWVQGDVFQPLGMSGNKKISDFLIDSKVSLPDKKKIKVLVSNGKILWVIGMRIDDKFKMTTSTKKVLLLTLIDE